MKREFLYILFTVLFFGASVFFMLMQKKDVISGCKVIDLKSEYNGKDVTYFVVCENEIFQTNTLICGNMYPNSDIFLHLEKGKKYDFTVRGIGLNIFGLHRNILSFYEKDVTISE